MASILRRTVAAVKSRLAACAPHRHPSPMVGALNFGDLRTTEPVSRVFGLDRGTPIDRYYIESFLAENASAIRGRVLEIGDATYTKRFGGSAVEVSDVLHVTGDAPQATIVADLTDAPSIAADTFDCIILTQTLQFTYHMEATVSELQRILKPGGTVLCTVPGISQISRYDMDRWGDYWRLTSLSARTLFETAFKSTHIDVSTYGNVFAAVAFLHGIALKEVSTDDLDVADDDYQVIVSVAATKASSA